MAFILRQHDFLFSSVPEGHVLTLALVISFSVLFLVIMGIGAVFVYRRWKKKRTMIVNTPDEDVPMNPVTVQPTEEQVS